MVTSCNGNIFRVIGPLCGEFTGRRWIHRKGQWRGALMFSLIFAWINGWANNSKAGDLRRLRTHYDITTMYISIAKRIQTKRLCRSTRKLKKLVESHYNDVIRSAMASQITSLRIVYSTVYSGVDQRKHQSSASRAFVQGIHRSLVNSPHKRPVTRKMFPCDDVIKCAYITRRH